MNDVLYNIKLWVGFKFLGWHKPKDYDYGYFVDKITVVMKKRVKNNQKLKTVMKIFPDEGIDWWK